MLDYEPKIIGKPLIIALNNDWFQVFYEKTAWRTENALILLQSLLCQLSREKQWITLVKVVRIMLYAR